MDKSAGNQKFTNWSLNHKVFSEFVPELPHQARLLNISCKEKHENQINLVFIILRYFWILSE